MPPPSNGRDMTLTVMTSSVRRRSRIFQKYGVQVIGTAKGMGRAYANRPTVPVLDIVKDRIARDWDRGLSIRSLARMYDLTTAAVDAVLYEKRARGYLPPAGAKVA